MPNNETAVSACNQKAVIYILNPLRQLLCKQCTNDQTEAPVNPAGNDGNDGHDDNRASGGFGGRSQSTKKLLENGTARKYIPCYKYQDHLHGKCKQSPEAASPMLYHLCRRAIGKNKSKTEYHECQNDNKKEWIW